MGESSVHSHSVIQLIVDRLKSPTKTSSLPEQNSKRKLIKMSFSTTEMDGGQYTEIKHKE